MGAGDQLFWWTLIVIPGVIPPLGRSTRMLCIFGALGAAFPLFAWATAITATDDKTRALSIFIAWYPTVSWILGMVIAILQWIGIARGWVWARFPIPALTALFVIGTLNFYAIGRFFGWL